MIMEQNENLIYEFFKQKLGWQFTARSTLVHAIGTHVAIFANIGAETQSPSGRGSSRYAKRQRIDL